MPQRSIVVYRFIFLLPNKLLDVFCISPVPDGIVAGLGAKINGLVSFAAGLPAVRGDTQSLVFAMKNLSPVLRDAVHEGLAFKEMVNQKHHGCIALALGGEDFV